jgi:hypothetical protein
VLRRIWPVRGGHKAALAPLGLDLNFPITYVQSTSTAIAFVENKSCYITPAAARTGQREFTKTILEEAIHINHDCEDYSRTFQEALLEITMKALERAK